jgi:hypothetical protein
MSPTTKELVSNKPLAGLELADIIRQDVDRMLRDNGLLSGQTAYSRIAYSLRLTLHLDLPQMPLSVDTASSRPQATDRIAANPALATLEAAPPLASPTPDAILDSSQLVRDIQSPNLARVGAGLPITVEVMGQDGHQREELVGYSPKDVGMDAAAFPEPDLSDVTPEMRKELGL